MQNVYVAKCVKSEVLKGNIWEESAPSQNFLTVRIHTVCTVLATSRLRKSSDKKPSIYLSVHSSPLSSSSVTLSAQGSGQPWLPFVMAASPLTAAVSCGLALNCAPATVNVYVYQSNAMCLCYMALWTRRLSETHGLRRSAVQDEGFMVR